MKNLRVFAFALLASLVLATQALAQFSGYPPVGSLEIGQDGSRAPVWNPITGDCTLSAIGVLICTSTNGVLFYKGVPTPSLPGDAATKQYVDSTSTGIFPHQQAALGTAAALPTNVYNNGASGVGATLTATANAALTVDGTAVSSGQRILVKNEAAAANNGIYTVTNTGAVGAAYVLTRATDANTAGTGSANLMGIGSYVLVTGGAANASTGWTVNSTVATIGTSAINFAQFTGATGVSSIGGAGGAFACGSGVNCAGSTIAVTLTNYIGGLILSNDIGTPNTVLDITTGQATDSTNAVNMSLGAFTKSVAGAWGAGSGTNGMGNGLTVAINTWYHVCLANNNAVPDVWFDTAATCTHRPAGITDTKFRRIGSFKTDGSARITPFLQTGNNFWRPQATEFSGTTRALTLLTLANVPTGVVVLPIIGAYLEPNLNFYAIATVAPGANIGLSILLAYSIASSSQPGIAIGWMTGPPTDTSANIYFGISLPNGGTMILGSLFSNGYLDFRGQNF